MAGRDPDEAHRVATPLELLFDLTFATCFSLAAAQFARILAEGRTGAALLAFGFASFAICWAWMNFSWFSSAYDTDDWIFRLVTMVQMVGVLVLATGLPRLFASLERGDRLDNSVMVLGYVIMRVALVSQWLRASSQDPARRRACLTYAVGIAIAQVGWVLQIAVGFSTAVVVPLGILLACWEFTVPPFAERKDGGTPWHAHHIAERYSLFALIAMGEGIVGTVAALSAAVERHGWTVEAALVALAGTGLTFGVWWVYFLIPSAAMLQRHRARALLWAYVQVVIVTAIVATGAGLHVAAYFIEHTDRISPLGTVLGVAVPVGVFVGLIYALYYYLVRRFTRLHAWSLIATAAFVGFAVVAALSGINMATCLVILMFAPTVTVIGYEVPAKRQHADALVE